MNRSARVVTNDMPPWQGRAVPPDTDPSATSNTAQRSADGITEDTGSPSSSVLGEISNTFASVRRVIANFFELVTLEARRAGLTFMWMVVWGSIAAILVVTGWLGFMGAVALWAVSLGATWISAIVAIAIANFLAATIILFTCVVKSRDLLFPATRRQLQEKPDRDDQP